MKKKKKSVLLPSVSAAPLRPYAGHSRTTDYNELKHLKPQPQQFTDYNDLDDETQYSEAGQFQSMNNERSPSACPLLDAMEKRCRGIDILSGDIHQELLPICGIHQMCYLCVTIFLLLLLFKITIISLITIREHRKRHAIYST